MTMPKVMITRKIPEDTLAYIKKYCEVIMWEEDDVPVSTDFLIENITKVEGLLCLITENIDGNILENAPNLKVISNMAVGYNNIDVDSARERGIIVTNTPGILTETTADLTFALLMATARRVVEADRFLREGKWKTWSPMFFTGQDIYGATIGIIGMGRIGEAVARRARGFSMNVVYSNRSRNEGAEKELNATYLSKEELLKVSDYVVILTPFSKETQNLISNDELALMKSTAILINTSRGGIVNEEALYEALSTKRIWAAGLDVFNEEPVPTDHPLLSLPNVVAIPHIGSASVKTRMAMANLAAENLVRVLKGDTCENIV